MALKSENSTRAAFDAMNATANAGNLRLYSGAIPATADDAAGTQIVSNITLPTPAFSAATVNTIQASSTLQGVPLSGTATASALCTYYRIYGSTGTVQSQGTVTATGGGGDLEFDDPNFTANGTVTIDLLDVDLLVAND